jgi:putative transposase
VVFIPKYRKKSIYGWVRKELGPIIRDLAQQKESVVEEGHLMADHVHMLLSTRIETVGFPSLRHS